MSELLDKQKGLEVSADNRERVKHRILEQNQQEGYILQNKLLKEHSETKKKQEEMIARGYKVQEGNRAEMMGGIHEVLNTMDLKSNLILEKGE